MEETLISYDWGIDCCCDVFMERLCLGFLFWPMMGDDNADAADVVSFFVCSGFVGCVSELSVVCVWEKI